jgi:hypothetical protein
MSSKNKSRTTVILLSVILVIVILILTLWAPETNPAARLFQNPTAAALNHEQENFTRADTVPALPFPDNPDPDQCGIPIEWGENGQAWLNGYYEGELIEPIVHLYDSHLRLEVTAQAPHGTEVEILLYQSNPVLDYYLVKIKGESGAQSEGWVPAPLLSFEPVG